jgi:hypothetical protein
VHIAMNGWKYPTMDGGVYGAGKFVLIALWLHGRLPQVQEVGGSDI